MTRFFLLFLLSVFLSASLRAQIDADSDSVKKDSPIIKKKAIVRDTLPKIISKKIDSSIAKEDSATTLKIDTSIISKDKKNVVIPLDFYLMKKALLQNPYFNFYGKMQLLDIEPHKPSSTDGIFYLIFGLCFYFALVRLFFRRYLNNLFSLFFRASMRQQQIREQALQAPLPSLLLNVLFVLTLGLYACFLIRYYQYADQMEFWLLYSYCVLTIAAIYTIKFSLLKLCGWVFNVSKASDNYIFVVFLVNKILGISLLPFLMIIAFSNPETVDIAIAVSILMVVILFVYRFIGAFGMIRSEIKLTVFHYFIYLCAFEMAPLLLIYKVVLSFLKNAH